MASKSGLKRRDALKIIGTSTFGTTGIKITGARGPNYTTIVTDEWKGRPLVTEQVPNRWYEMVLHSRKVRDQLLLEYSDKPWFSSIARAKGSERIEGFRSYRIVVSATDTQIAQKHLPNEVEGLPIEVKEERTPEPECQCNSSSHYCVPGGVAVDTENELGSFDCHSGGIMVEYAGEYHYMTVAHGFAHKDNPCIDISGHELRSGKDSSLTVGRVQTYDWDQDWAIVDQASDMDVNGLDNKVYSYGNPVQGHVTQDGIDYLIGSDETVYKYGAMTCSSSGTVDRQSTWTHCNDPHEWVVTIMNSSGGDSGSPHFRVHDGLGVNTIIGIHQGSDGYGGAWASAAYLINNDWGVEFGGSSSTC